MKVVIDTNLIVSAAMRDGIPEEVIRLVIANPEIDWVASTEIMVEYRSVLQRPKFKLPDSTLRGWLELVNDVVQIHDCNVEVDFPRDLKDAKFIACALATKVDYLISGDRDFEAANLPDFTAVVTPALFKRMLEHP